MSASSTPSPVVCIVSALDKETLSVTDSLFLSLSKMGKKITAEARNYLIVKKKQISLFIDDTVFILLQIYPAHSHFNTLYY